MSASQVIEEIKGLPLEERQKVVAYCQSLAAGDAVGPKVVYAEHKEAMQVLEEVFDRNEELFKKLAQ